MTSKKLRLLILIVIIAVFIHMLGELLVYCISGSYLFHLGAFATTTAPIAVILAGTALCSIAIPLGLVMLNVFPFTFAAASSRTRKAINATSCVYVIVLTVYHSSLGFVGVAFSSINQISDHLLIQTVRNTLLSNYSMLYFVVEMIMTLISVFIGFLMIETILKGKSMLPKRTVVLVPFASFLLTRVCANFVEDVHPIFAIIAIVFDDLVMIAFVFIIYKYTALAVDTRTNQVSRAFAKIGLTGAIQKMPDPSEVGYAVSERKKAIMNM